jgi:hypothetical protein
LRPLRPKQYTPIASIPGNPEKISCALATGAHSAIVTRAQQAAMTSAAAYGSVGFLNGSFFATTHYLYGQDPWHVTAGDAPGALESIVKASQLDSYGMKNRSDHMHAV